MPRRPQPLPNVTRSNPTPVAIEPEEANDAATATVPPLDVDDLDDRDDQSPEGILGIEDEGDDEEDGDGDDYLVNMQPSPIPHELIGQLAYSWARVRPLDLDGFRNSVILAINAGANLFPLQARGRKRFDDRLETVLRASLRDVPEISKYHDLRAKAESARLAVKLLELEVTEKSARRERLIHEPGSLSGEALVQELGQLRSDVTTLERRIERSKGGIEDLTKEVIAAKRRAEERAEEVGRSAALRVKTELNGQLVAAQEKVLDALRPLLTELIELHSIQSISLEAGYHVRLRRMLNETPAPAPAASAEASPA